MASHWTPSLHPRDRRGRWTASRSRPMTADDRSRANELSARFDPPGGTDPEVHQRLAANTRPETLGEMLDESWTRIAELLRSPSRTQTADPAITALDSAMRPLPEDVELTRPVPAAVFGRLSPADLIGVVVRDSAYSPAQVGGPHQDAEVILHIKAPAGTPAVAIPDSQHYEVLLDRGQEFAVVDAQQDTTGQWAVDLVALPSIGPTTPTNRGYRPAGRLATPDYRSVAELPDTDEYSTSDLRLGELWRQQGFDGLPELVTAERMDELESAGWTRIFRGMSADEPDAARQVAEFRDQWANGPDPFPGTGVYGNGTYTTTNRAAAENYRGMRDDGVLFDMALRPDARTITKDELFEQHESYMAALDERIARSTGRARARLEAERSVMKDEGRWATIQGYDAIVAKRRRGNETYVVVLNRSATALVAPEAELA